MTKKEEEFLKRLQSIFRVEAEEHVNVLSSSLIELEKYPEIKKAQELIEIIFREAHSLKGAARSVNRNDIESICQKLEGAFAKLKSKQISFTAAHFDIIHKVLNTISGLISGNAVKTNDEYKVLLKQIESITESDTIKQIEKKIIPDTKEETGQLKIQNEKLHASTNFSNKEPVQKMIPEKKEFISAGPVKEISHQSDTVRIQTAALDTLFLQAEQMIQSKIAFNQRFADLKNIYDFIGSWKTQLRKFDTHHFTDSSNQFKELVKWTNEKLDETERNIFSVTHLLENDQRSLGHMIDDHVEYMKKALMLPVSVLIEVFPRLVRELARSQRKEVSLIIHGKETEVDKRILEVLKDPLIHLIRNCIDHGIKCPEEQMKLNKLPYGTISLDFSIIDSRNLEIKISDDGSGIQIEKVISSAIKAGIISKDNAEKMTNQESLSLIFCSGISTSPIITDISGRGLGLAIVQEKVEKLGGTISVASLPDKGTTFRILLPFTISTLRGVMVRSGEHLFIIPSTHVECVVRVNKDNISTVENNDTILIGKEIIVTLKLSDVLGLNDNTHAQSSQKWNTSSSDFIQIVVLVQAEKKIGLKVDEIFGEHQILMKELGKQLIRVQNFSGATVLGTGKVVPVLNASDLLKSALSVVSTVKITEYNKQVDTKIYKILVTDDSITSRSLIKNILETAGYNVVTAVDGIDAFTKALIEDFDLIVSDVDMPRLNGFELTAKIRKEKKLSEMPVILVTALESNEDREHGIDVGANAYIVKSSFDQSNLLEVIKKLL